MQTPLDVCRCCGSAGAKEFLHRDGVPVHQNMVYRDEAAARTAPRGTLSMHCCGACGFVYNGAFDPSLLEYGPNYDNSQQLSPRFDAHLESLVRRLIGPGGIRGRQVVEVGCGNGDFLRRFLRASGGGLTAVGFDPAFVGDERPQPGLTFRREFFGAASNATAEAVISRHVIEHVECPVEFLKTIRAAMPAGGRLFLETPCVDWILAGKVIWDFFYEHCSLFSRETLADACRHAGFKVDQIGHVFDGQYLWLEATANKSNPNECKAARTPRLAAATGRWENDQRECWSAHVAHCANRGPVFLWGAGAKGTTFCNLIDPARRFIAGVVDINPGKQGGFIGGSSHPILAPAGVRDQANATVLILNPNYREEIAAELSRLGATVAAIEAMTTEALAA